MKGMETLWPSVRVFAGACLLLLVAACGDEPAAPETVEQELEGPAGQAFSALLTCSVDVVAGSMSCDPSDGLSGTAAGPQMNLIVGSQHRFVRMANDAPVVSGDVWSANVWVQNLTLQPFGTSDGETADAPSVQVFFVDEPNNGVEVLNHDDTDIFLDSTPAKYYTYFTILLGSDWILSPGEESTARPWEFQLNGATEFQFSVLVSTVVPDPDAIGVHLTRVSAGGSHACGDGLDGKVYCWGENSSGQLGDGTVTTDKWTPVAVEAPGNVRLSGVSAGWGHSCAEGDDQYIYCWGDNDYGQLGDGTWTDRSRPVLVAGTRGL